MGKLAKNALGAFAPTAVFILLVVLFVTVSASPLFALQSDLLDSNLLESSSLSESLVTPSIETRLAGRQGRERANIKSAEIVKLDLNGEYTRGGITMEIERVEKIDGGLQVFARAWKNEVQIGFGPNHTTEWERFLIFNPPVLVGDEVGAIERHATDENNNAVVHRYREDPKEALLVTLAHTMSVSGVIGASVTPGTHGNTTSTFYPMAGENGPMDGEVHINWNDSGTCYSWTEVRDGSTGTGASATETYNRIAALYIDAVTPPNCNGSENFFSMHRSMFLFDTSSLGSDTIASATFSMYGQNKSNNTLDWSIGLVSSNPASTSTITTADYDDFGTTRFASDIAYSSFTTSGYNDFTLNGSGIAAVNGSGVSEFGLRLSADIDDDEPSTADGYNTQFFGYFADQTGTTNDPKLVIVHSTAASEPTSLLANGQSNPSNLSGSTPGFSAIYNDSDTDDVAYSYQIQVATSSSFTSSYWDSGKTSLASSTPQGARIDEVVYGGSVLASSTTYYWRIKFWDEADVEGAWSTETATFSLLGPGTQKVRKPLNESVSDSTVQQSDNDLRLALSSDTVYIVDGVLFATSTSGVPDLTIGFEVPTDSTLTIGYVNQVDEEVLMENATSSRIAIQANIPRSVHFKGTVTTSSTAGDLTLRWAQATANSNSTTVMEGSYMRIDAI